MTLLLIAAALVLLFANASTIDKARILLALVPKPTVSWRHVAAIGLIGLAAMSMLGPRDAAPTPPPQPAPPSGPVDLTGLFQGATAAEDASIVAGLTGELAEEIYWDGQQDKPYFTTGVSLDELRRRARELRCRGISIGQRQPAARDAIAAYLDRTVGNSGGPIDATQRATWVAALRDISEAADRVTR